MKNFVKWFENEKSFGFIEYKNNGDIYIYYFAIQSKKEQTLIIEKRK